MQCVYTHLHVLPFLLFWSYRWCSFYVVDVFCLPCISSCLHHHFFTFLVTPLPFTMGISFTLHTHIAPPHFVHTTTSHTIFAIPAFYLFPHTPVCSIYIHFPLLSHRTYSHSVPGFVSKFYTPPACHTHNLSVQFLYLGSPDSVLCFVLRFFYVLSTTCCHTLHHRIPFYLLYTYHYIRFSSVYHSSTITHFLHTAYHFARSGLLHTPALSYFSFYIHTTLH